MRPCLKIIKRKGVGDDPLKNRSCFSVYYGTCQTLKSTEQHLTSHMCHPSLTIISWTNFIFPTLIDCLKIDTRCRVIPRNIVPDSLFMKVPSIWHGSNLSTIPQPLRWSHTSFPESISLCSTSFPASRSYYQRFIIHLLIFAISWNLPGNCLIIKN